MESFWNARYADPVYAYGTKPNEYLREKLPALPVGTLLAAAEGEGRNAVYAASLGHDVRAFDMSREGQRKALALAEAQGVSIQYAVNAADDFRVEKETVAVLTLIYAHFPAESKSRLNQQLAQAVQPGGYVIFEAFGKEQLAYQSGGPKDPAMLYSLAEVRADFPDFDELEGYEAIINLDEGPYHQGPGAVVRFFGRKR
jgi:SAM-dependent methyltransferase